MRIKLLVMSTCSGSLQLAIFQRNDLIFNLIILILNFIWIPIVKQQIENLCTSRFSLLENEITFENASHKKQIKV